MELLIRNVLETFEILLIFQLQISTTQITAHREMSKERHLSLASNTNSIPTKFPSSSPYPILILDICPITDKTVLYE